jgi:hypothetical protein
MSEQEVVTHEAGISAWCARALARSRARTNRARVTVAKRARQKPGTWKMGQTARNSAPGAKPEARFLIAQAGCIPTPFSSNATPSPARFEPQPRS